MQYALITEVLEQVLVYCEPGSYYSFVTSNSFLFIFYKGNVRGSI